MSSYSCSSVCVRNTNSFDKRLVITHVRHSVGASWGLGMESVESQQSSAGVWSDCGGESAAGHRRVQAWKGLCLMHTWPRIEWDWSMELFKGSTIVFAQNIGLPADFHSLNQFKELMNLSMISATKFDDCALRRMVVYLGNEQFWLVLIQPAVSTISALITKSMEWYSMIFSWTVWGNLFYIFYKSRSSKLALQWLFWMLLFLIPQMPGRELIRCLQVLYWDPGGFVASISFTCFWKQNKWKLIQIQSISGEWGWSGGVVLGLLTSTSSGDSSYFALLFALHWQM